MSTTNHEEFRAFGAYGAAQRRSGSWYSSLAASSVIYIVIGLLVLSIPVTKHIIQSKPIQLTFVEKVVKAPPPSHPPAPKLDAKDAVKAPQPHKPQPRRRRRLPRPSSGPIRRSGSSTSRRRRRSWWRPKEMPKEVAEGGRREPGQGHRGLR